MQECGCWQQAVSQAHEEGVRKQSLPHIPFGFATFDPCRPVLAALLEVYAETVSWFMPLLACQGKKRGPEGSRAAVKAWGWQTGFGGGKSGVRV